MTDSTNSQPVHDTNAESPEAKVAPTLRLVSETPESGTVIPPLPDRPPPQHKNPPRPHPWDLLWFW